MSSFASVATILRRWNMVFSKKVDSMWPVLFLKLLFNATFFVTRREKFTVSGNRCEQHGFQMFVIAMFCLTKRDFFRESNSLTNPSARHYKIFWKNPSFLYLSYVPKLYIVATLSRSSMWCSTIVLSFPTNWFTDFVAFATAQVKWLHRTLLASISVHFLKFNRLSCL